MLLQLFAVVEVCYYSYIQFDRKYLAVLSCFLENFGFTWQIRKSKLGKFKKV